MLTFGDQYVSLRVRRKDGGGCLTGMNQGVIVFGARFGGNDVGEHARASGEYFPGGGQVR